MARLDRSIIVKLENPDITPSRIDGVSVQEERQQRSHGIGLLNDAAPIIAPQQPHQQKVFRTASVIFHRYFHQVSLRKQDVWSIAMASLALACKLVEVKISFREIIVVFHHLYRKRILCLMEDPTQISHQHVATCHLSKSMALEEKMKLLQHSMTPLSTMGTIYRLWHDTMVQAESSILRQLGFTLYWIPDSHPDSLIDQLCKPLPDKVKTLSHEACDKTFYIDSCVRFSLPAIAHASITVATQWEGGQAPHPSDCNMQDVSDIANWILGLYDPSNTDMQLATHCFVPSYVTNASFNDPESLSWEVVVGCLSKGTS